ncbi:carotenoid oxygenase family protein [Nodosilinea sp. LEGE 06152]|uniref:carotenoid oxygenase family protein n=1 Tax=Nodosilinea sp. LEGE 06152 TaxID=2777966 RepID=UPI00187F06EA|nr:carotenoid oxygenase family protein [Nodosilinea sp. LEGE 06152]MBE9157018.1 carotenoid oxygenase family protein [Nodosilinea sp. LEGE 06152]
MDCSTSPIEEPKSPHDSSKDQRARHPYSIPTSVVKTCRAEVNGINLSVQTFTIGKQSELTVLPGDAHKLPPDLAGYYFVAAALAPEGTLVINGDGMLYRVHFASGEATLKSRIAKTPCYYADQITQRSSEYRKAYCFRDAGPSRSSPKLGNRNQLNTAFLQTTRRFIVTFDAGIPWVVDPDSMELIEPVGRMDEWISLTDPFADIAESLQKALQDVVFPPHSNPAHPVCDRFRPGNSFPGISHHPPAVLTQDHFLTLNYSIGYKGKFRKTFDRLLGKLRRRTVKGAGFWARKLGVAPVLSWLRQITVKGADFWVRKLGLGSAILARPASDSQQVYGSRVYGFTDLLRYTFSDRKLERWQLVLPDWNKESPDISKLVIGEQSVHQMVITEDYIVLADIAFKIEFSQIFSFAKLPEEWLNKILAVLALLIDSLPQGQKGRESLQQWLLNKQLQVGYWLYIKLLQLIPPSQTTNFYIISRSCLKSSANGSGSATGHKQSVRVREVNIPREVSHFTADYSNPQGKITLHIGHNNSTDVTEWISKYDRPVTPEQRGLSEKDYQRLEEYFQRLKKNFQRLTGMTTGAMDVSSFGRYVIDGETGALLDSKIISDVEHTWWPSVYTHRDICRDRPSEHKNKEIKTMFWMCNGFSWEIVPERLYQIYKDRDFRVIHHTGLPETGKPCKLLRLDTETMEIIDWFDFPAGHFACSPQFIPKTTPCPEGQDLNTHGYIACVVLADAPDEHAGTANASSQDEFWVFDGNNLGNRKNTDQAAIVYKLSCSKKPLNLGMTIHSIWLSEDDFSTKSQEYLDPNVRRNRREDAFWRDYGALLPDAGDGYSRIDAPRTLKKKDKKTETLFRDVHKAFIEQMREGSITWTK